MIWLDSFVEHSWPGGFRREFDPMSLTCSIITLLCNLLMTHSKYDFICIISMVVCLRGLYHHSVLLLLSYILSDVYLRLSQFSQLFFIWYVGAVYIQLVHFPRDDYENICTLSYYHHEIRCMAHLALIRARSWNRGMSCMSSCIPVRMIRMLCNSNMNVIIIFIYVKLI